MKAATRYFTAPQVRRRYGGRSDMWLHRILNKPESGFPQPLYLNGRRYWDESWLERWELRQGRGRDSK